MARGIPWAAAWDLEEADVEPFVAAFDQVHQAQQDRLAAVVASRIGTDAGG